MPWPVLKSIPQLIGSLAEVYYKEYSDQKGGWAFTSLEGVHTKIDSKVLDFKMGFNRLQVRIPEELIPEIKDVSKPKLVKGSPSYVFDFLACKIKDTESISDILNKSSDNFRWIEVKSEGGKVSSNQLETMNKVEISFVLVVVYNVRKTPLDVDLQFSFMIKSQVRWLNPRLFPPRVTPMPNLHCLLKPLL